MSAPRRKVDFGPKCDRIREIWADNRRVEQRIVRRFEAEVDAYQFEADRIHEIGIENLTNISPGGFGGRMSPYYKIKRSKKMLRRFAPILARAILQVHFRPNAKFGGIEIGPTIRSFVNTFIEEAGFEAVADAVLPHGVKLEKQS